MKRQNNVRWKEGSETPQKKRTKSLNIAKKPIDHLNHDTIPNSFSNIKKLLSLDSENIEKESTEKISVSSIPDGEFFSEINFNIKLTVDNVIRNDDQQILDCKTHKVILMDDWKNIIMYKGMTISIFDCPCCNTSTNIVDTEIVVDATNHIMTIDDAIIPVTTYCEAFNCIYKPLLKEKIIDITFQYSHSSMAVGVIIHSVIEMCLKANNFTLKFIVEKLKAVIADNTSLLYACDLSSKNAMIDCTKFIKNIMKLSEQPSFARCCAVEKKIVSHMYSLRGNIDAVLLDNGCQIPLEIKTGKRVDFKHYAQIIMYLLMTREKNTENVSHGLLYYAHEGLLKKINLKHNEVMSLCILRNEIASIRYETKQKVRTDRNFVGYPESFNPVCKCDDIEYCKTIKNLFLLEEFKGDFLREQWLAINEDEECQKQTEFYPSIFIEQKDNNLVVAVDIQEINNIREFLEIYDINKNRICFGRMTRIENNKVYLTLNTSYNLLCYYNLYICNTKNELFYKTMRYSLLNVAITSDVFNIDNSTQDKKEYNCITSSAEKYLEFMTQLETQNTNDKISEIIPLPYRQDFFELNEDQRSALYLALNCKKYHLVHGFPGTGKSHLIRLFIKILCYTKKKVLLICYTNLALDNILDKLPVKYYRALKDKNKFNDTESMRRYFDGIELVAGTCFSFTDVIFLQRKFDFCIVDEASQQHFLLTLIPISLSNKFLLVGDHLQLKPISVKSQCLQISLFEHLIKTQRSELKLQYRMPDNIMNLSNRLFYDNKMKGTGRKGTIEFIDTDGDYKDIINTILKKTKPTRRDLEKKNIHSENILDRMNMILEASKESANTFINEDDLTILCYFNSTVSQIRANTNNNVNVETIDKFQGSEAKHIVVVFDPIIDCEIMNSKERLNVSLTRAKERLTLIGDSTKMKTIGVLAEMLDLLI